MKRELRLGVSLLAFVPLGNQRALLPEIAMWPLATEEMGGVPILDAGIPKQRCEYLVAGSAYPGLGEERRECAVAASVAGRRKTLLVSGDRYWLDARSSEPLPFNKLPLDWSLAFGGPDYAQNPVGGGLVPRDVRGLPMLPLPNIEYPDDQALSPSSRPRPGGFRALDVTHPDRASKAGTHDARWLREDFPGFARDIDWKFFNVAPADQQFEQDAFASDTEYEFQNMHPTRQVVAGRLPKLRPRCFVSRSGKPPEAFEEVLLRLTTLWFFPGRERGLLIFQGAVEVSEDDASDITHLLAAAEDAEVESRPPSYYAEVLARRLDPQKGHLYALKDGELCPSELSPTDPAEAQLQADLTGEGLVEQRMKQRRERAIAAGRAEVESYGLDPDEHGPVSHAEEPMPALEDLPAYLEKVQADADRQQRELAEQAELRDRVNEALFAGLGLDYAVVKAELVQKHGGPPSFSAEGKAADLRKLIATFAAQGLPTEHVQEILDDPEQQRLWRTAEKQGREAYRVAAHLQHPAPECDAQGSAQVRALLLERKASGAPGADFTGADFTGTDLSGLDLSGAMLEGTLLESARLAGTNLRGARLAGAVLAHADLRGADLEGADLRGTNLGAAQLGDANLSNTQLEGTILSRASLERTRFDGARIALTDFTGARFEGTSFARAKAADTNFLECELRGVDFSGAELLRCNFLRADVREARFRDSDLSEAVFLGVQAQDADFTRAKLVQFRSVEACSFERACFLGADLTGANLRGATLRLTRFEGAKLDDADLSGADLEQANLYRATALRARFGRANLTRAQLVAANLLEASFASARLDDADFTGANVFAADLSRIHGNSGTRFASASLQQVRIHPLRSGQRSPLPDSGAA